MASSPCSCSCSCRSLLLPPSPIKKPNYYCCFAFNSNSNSITHQQLRFQLDQLHTEAETTRSQANRARLRLLRLSESAERLKGQASVSLHSGKENEARELLFQKKKVMQTLEKLKSRIELLDKLYAKLNEAITIKEDQLMGNIAFDLEVDREYTSGTVEIVYPMQGVPNDTNEEDTNDSSHSPSFAESHDLQLSAVDVARKMEEESVSVSRSFSEVSSMINGLEGISSYEDFLEHLDQQLNKIEAELITILNVSTLVLNDSEKLQNLKVQHTQEILESIRAIRQKITHVKQFKMENQ